MDRELAGQKYEQIRIRLIKIFASRGCVDAEDLADEAINRVVSKVAHVASTYEGDPAFYFYGVANKLHLEQLRKNQPKELPLHLMVATAEDREAELACLDRCLEELSAENRILVLRYYAGEKHEKIAGRKSLAYELGLAVNALRIRAHRIRLILQECVTRCLESSPSN